MYWSTMMEALRSYSLGPRFDPCLMHILIGQGVLPALSLSDILNEYLATRG